MTDKPYIIGIDTGGTYTDAVVIDQRHHRILSSAKALTTKGDLALGVGEAMAKAVADLKGEVAASAIGLVSISTTLATNAVVEGHGSPAAMIFIGFDDKMVERTGIAQAFPGLPILRVAGGHDHNGDAVHKLDIADLTEKLATLKGQVGAVAIASTFAVRNNAHETEARALVSKLLECPVTVSSELSQALDAPRRALTAMLNARLIAYISRLIAAVWRAMEKLGISAELTIMKGDGTLASAQSVVQRPIETVLSGPAASLVGAKWISGFDDFVMSDMGGTTTDVGILEKGRPLVAPQGAEVGGWRTMVQAIDVKTIGLGGDSEVAVGMNGAISIGPQRAVPISLISQRFPDVIAMLESDLGETEGGSLLGRFVLQPFGKDDRLQPHGLSTREEEILALVTDHPVPLRKVAVSSAAQRALASLRKKGLVQLAAFTPSDAAHVLGLQANWDSRGAELAARQTARFRLMRMPQEIEVQNFCREVWGETVRKSARVIIDTVLGDIRDSDSLIDAVCSGTAHVGRAAVAIRPQMPIVAVGGPVRVFYDEVAKRLSTDVVFAPYCDVANAVGAASALVADRVVVTVEGDGNGLFRVHGAGRAQQFYSGVQALAEAERLAAETALAQATARGARNAKLSTTIEKAMLPDAKDDEGLLTAKVTAEAIGAPV
jgi:N-methylhydantoinase A/oxoprolinase/acetone carboxylase beta subunit